MLLARLVVPLHQLPVAVQVIEKVLFVQRPGQTLRLFEHALVQLYVQAKARHAAGIGNIRFLGPAGGIASLVDVDVGGPDLGMGNQATMSPPSVATRS